MEQSKGYLVIEQKGNGEQSVIFADNASCELIGLSLEKLISKNPADAAEALCVSKVKLDNEHEIWILTANSSESTKISELEQINANLEAALKEAEAANKAKTDFLSSMSHDIRTPMNAIMGMTTIGLSHIDEKPRVLDCLQKISTASSHLMSLVNDVLDLSRIDSGRLVLNEEAFSLADIIHDISVIVRPQAAAKKQELQIELDRIYEEDIIGDPLRLRQILVNIIGNAVKYTPENGKITVKLSQFIKKDESGRDGAVWLDFVCEDNGIGMSSDFVKRIFVPFERDKNADTEKIEGTGLGMAIVKNIIDKMNGTIDVKSEKGKGSSFHIRLPVTPADNSGVPFRLPSNRRVLVTEGKKSSADQICEYLSESGFEPAVVTNGLELVTWLTENRYEDNMPCIMLLGQEIEDISVIELAAHVRQLVGKSLPIVYVSETDWSNIEYRATRAGINAFVPCPLFKSKLLRTVLELTDKGEISDGTDYLSEDYSQHRILLVEDVEINREIIIEMLFSTGIKVETAGNGLEAVEMFTRSSQGYYDLVFMDVKMPIMDGYEATRQIRALPRDDAQTVWIVAMTADAFVEDIRKAKSSGMNEHCSKPVDPRRLIEIIHNRFGK